MWPFSLFKRRQPPPLPRVHANGPISADDFLASFDTTDYLGDAARLGNEANEAMREKRYDDAWRLLHQQKERYGKHAVRYGMTTRQAVALDASVHEELANIRRLEGNHDDALVHLLYCVWSSARPTKAQGKKIDAYFRRCEFTGVSLDDLSLFKQSTSDFRAIRASVTNWRTKNKN
jgi:hypothetical protein